MEWSSLIVCPEILIRQFWISNMIGFITNTNFKTYNTSGTEKAIYGNDHFPGCFVLEKFREKELLVCTILLDLRERKEEIVRMDRKREKVTHREEEMRNEKQGFPS